MRSSGALPALRLWKGETVHVRFRPVRRNFKYRITLIDLDIDRLHEAGKTSPFMSIDRPGLFSFRSRDHGARDGSALRPWAEAQLQAAGVDTDGGSIRLVSFPRHLFYRFAPISLWLSHDLGGRLNGVIYEVNNTFGETHSYASRIDSDAIARHQSGKNFHVSPFMDVEGDYRFTLLSDDDELELRVDNVSAEGRSHTATISAEPRNVTSSALLATAITSPLSSFGVTFGIHWQALKVWAGGIGYRRKPPPPTQALTVAQPVQTPSNAPEQRQAAE